MKRTAVLVVALLALFAVGSIANAAKNNTKKFDSTVTVKYKAGGSTDPYAPSTDPDFKGRVESGKGFCFKNRKVKVKGKGGIGTVGSDLTNGSGRYHVDAPGFGSGDYKAKVVKKKKTKKNGGKIICKSAKADITVE